MSPIREFSPCVISMTQVCICGRDPQSEGVYFSAEEDQQVRSRSPALVGEMGASTKAPATGLAEEGIAQGINPQGRAVGRC